MSKTISILGSTGSIGRQTLDVAEQMGLRVAAITARSSVDRVEEQVRKFRPSLAVLTDEAAARELAVRLADTGTKVIGGPEGLLEAAVLPEADTVVTAVVGMVGLKPTLAAIEAKKRIALANKETLVCAGQLVMDAADRFGAEIVPVDSEHSAIFQCVQGCRDRREIRRLILTCSGGPFYGMTREEAGRMTRADALRHPNWTMGPKITVDCATLMNKGLEVIEACHLYGVSVDEVDVLVHPQSLVHSLVEFEDGSLMAQAGTPDMRMPIAYCLAWPLCLDAGVPPLDLARSGALTFEEPDLHSFPCLELACRTIGKGSALPVALNAANEVAVEAFLSGRIGFMDIPDIIGRALDECSAPDPASLEAIETLDHETRLRVGLWIEKV